MDLQGIYLNITRLECKDTMTEGTKADGGYLNRTRLECKEIGT